jgi:outer membrane immunogenic protein
MKNVTIAMALAVFAAAPALAAKAKKTPPAPPPTPAYSWSGCYVGVNGGYGWNDGRAHYNDPNTTPDPINFIPNQVPAVADIFIPTPAGTGGAGGLAGGGAGCNWQNQQWVFGLEADIDGGRISGSQANTVATGVGQSIAINPVLALFNATGAASEQRSKIACCCLQPGDWPSVQ